jgi:hypothetical protein
MKNRIWLVVGMLLVLSLGLAVTVQADELKGSGHLWAKGIGYAEVHGNGAVDVSVRGAATVWVKGAEVLRAEGTGRRWDLPGGGTVFAGWKGQIEIRGSELDVKMWGGVLELDARGTGWAFLKGRGVYRLNGESGRWTRDGVRLDL